MKKTLIWIASVIGVAAVVVLVYDYFLKSSAIPRVVATSGECLTTAPKDRTAITLRVRTLDKSAAVSMRQATEKVTKITDFLKTQDVKMQTTQFDSYEKTEWDRDTQKSVSLGIETSIAIEVSADNIEKIETVLNQFAGQEDIFSDNIRMFTSAETLKPILEQCLGAAVENARARASAIASGDGKKVGKMISATYETQSGDVFLPSNFMRSAQPAMAMDSISVGGGLVSRDTELSVSVSAIFEMK